MQSFLANFHFLRADWLFVLLPLLIIWWLIWRAKNNTSHWQAIIPEYLLKYLIEGKTVPAARWHFFALAIAWLIAVIALAGPAWQQLPLPIHRSESAVIVILDLSPSMHAEDIKPSRLTRARYKITDYLNQRDEGTSALIVYGGEAHVVSPLTDDRETINNLLPALEPGIMPLAGANVEMAISEAIDLFKDSNLTQGDIVLFTDGIAPDALGTINRSLSNTAYRLSIVGIGTDAGAPIPGTNGGFSKDAAGNIVVAKLNSGELQRLAMELGGTYTSLRSDNKDISQVNDFIAQHDFAEEQRKIIERDFDTWRDNGHWLAILLIPFALLAFRRGWLLTLFVPVLLFPESSNALGWKDLWLTPDQQGQQSFHQGELDKAAEEFSDHAWQGSAHYRNGDYAAAEQAFAQGSSASDHYNRGNALLQQGKTEEAIAAYEQALQLDPELEDAKANEALAKQISEQKKQQEQQQQAGDKSENSEGEKSDESQQGQSAEGDSDKEKSDQDGVDGEESDPSQSADGRSQDQQSQGQQSQDQLSQEDNANNSERSSGNPSESDEESAQQLAQEQSTQEELSQEQLDKLAELQKEEQQNSAQASHQEPVQSEQITEQQMAAQQAGEHGDENSDPQMSQLTLQQQAENAEKQQALEQWLRQVPDDPSGLLKRKFEYEHRQLRQQYRAGEWVPPENGAYDRW